MLADIIKQYTTIISYHQQDKPSYYLILSTLWIKLFKLIQQITIFKYRFFELKEIRKVKIGRVEILLESVFIRRIIILIKMLGLAYMKAVMAMILIMITYQLFEENI